jgi:hypothetical protein
VSDLASQGFHVWDGTAYVAPEPPKAAETLQDAYLYHYDVQGLYGDGEWHSLWSADLPLLVACRIAELESYHRREMRVVDTKTGEVIKSCPYMPHVPKS